MSALLTEAAKQAAVEAVQEEFDEHGLGDASLIVSVILDEFVSHHATTGREALVISVAQGIARGAGETHRGWVRWRPHAEAVVAGLLATNDNDGRQEADRA